MDGWTDGQKTPGFHRNARTIAQYPLRLEKRQERFFLPTPESFGGGGGEFYIRRILFGISASNQRRDSHLLTSTAETPLKKKSSWKFGSSTDFIFVLNFCFFTGRRARRICTLSAPP